MGRANITFLFLSGLVACGGSSSSNTDAPGSIDAAVDAPPALAMVTLSGKAEEIGANGSTPVAGVLVEAYRSSDEATVVAMATSDAQGMFTMTITTGGVGLDGFVKATMATYMDTYLYPPGFIVGDTSVPVKLVKPGTFDFIELLTGEMQDPANGFVAMIVNDAAGMPVGAATAASTPAPGAVKYNGGNMGLPSKTATSTHTDGVAYLFNVPAGQATVSADKAGSTFMSHGLKSRPGALTTTLVTP